MEKEDMIAPCGLDCSKCSIYRAKDEPETMQGIIDWFYKDKGVKFVPEQVKCGGCLGDRSIHWSSDCDILRCSVDDRGLTSCSACQEMPCQRLETWSKYGRNYADAVDRLKRMKSG